MAKNGAIKLFCVRAPYLGQTAVPAGKGSTDNAMALPYLFEWPVDQAGYDLVYDESEGLFLQARGGPPRYYRPMEVEGLWRRFANQCTDAHRKGLLGFREDHDGILAFVSEFGLTAAKPLLPLWKRSLADPQQWQAARVRGEAAETEPLQEIGALASLIREIAEHYDKNEHADAAALFNDYGSPELRAGILTNDRGRLEIALAPDDLEGALLLQTLETITGNYEWRHCRNEGCPNWFRIGSGGKTKRREFCSTRCRVAAAARRHKSGVPAK
jgi:hypothetical protein